MDDPIYINTDVDRKIADAFIMFDHRGDKCIDVREVGTILRFLGCVPTEQEINDVITHTELDISPGTIHLSKFLPHVNNLITERKMEPASPDKLLEAFNILDPDETGFLSKEFMSKIMTEEGEPFTQEELDEMLTIAVDPVTGNIPYEYYINQLMNCPEESIYELAQIELEKLKAETASKKSGRKKSILTRPTLTNK